MEVGYIDERISNLNCVMGHMSRGEACQDGDREEEEDKDRSSYFQEQKTSPNESKIGTYYPTQNSQTEMKINY